MAHVRQQIINAVVAKITGLATTGANVFSPKIWNFNEVQLPALAVFAKRETDIQPIDIRARATYRNLEIRIEGCSANDQSGIQTDLNTIAKEVEVALSTGVTLSDICKDTIYNGMEVDFDNSGDYPLGVIAMSYIFPYVISDTDPETAL